MEGVVILLLVLVLNYDLIFGLDKPRAVRNALHIHNLGIFAGLRVEFFYE